jgi:hypothetical protein
VDTAIDLDHEPHFEGREVSDVAPDDDLTTEGHTQAAALQLGPEPLLGWRLMWSMCWDLTSSSLWRLLTDDVDTHRELSRLRAALRFDHARRERTGIVRIQDAVLIVVRIGAATFVFEAILVFRVERTAVVTSRIPS